MNETVYSDIIIKHESNGQDENDSFTAEDVARGYPHFSEGQHVTLLYIVGAIGTVCLLGLLVALAMAFVKRTRVERLRRQLMPVYTYEVSERGSGSLHTRGSSRGTAGGANEDSSCWDGESDSDDAEGLYRCLSMEIRSVDRDVVIRSTNRPRGNSRRLDPHISMDKFFHVSH